MLVEVKVPQLSESVSEATLLAWHKKEGEAVKRDENLIDIETDKVVLELPAPADGVLVKIVKGDGGTVDLGRGDRADRHRGEGRRRAPRREAPAAPAAAPRRCRCADAGAAPKRPRRRAPDARGAQDRRREGRRPRHDRRAPAATAASPRATCSTRGAGPRRAGRGARRQPRPRRPCRRRRRGERRRACSPGARSSACRCRACAQRVAERLVQSQSTAAILTTFNEVNMAPVMELRKKYQERFEKEHGVKLGFMSFFVKAAVHALKKYPVVNASVDGNDIVYHGYFDIGIAVGSPRGLVVPILRDADQMSLRRHREEDRRLRQARPGRQAHHRGADRRHVLDLQRRRVRLDALDADHQPAAERDPRRARHQGARRWWRTARSWSGR